MEPLQAQNQIHALLQPGLPHDCCTNRLLADTLRSTGMKQVITWPALDNQPPDMHLHQSLENPR